MITKFKIFENDFEEDWEEEESLEEKIKQFLIDHPTCDNYYSAPIHIPKRDKRRIDNIFKGYNYYTKLYDHIDYDKIEKGTILKANIINISATPEEVIVMSDLYTQHPYHPTEWTQWVVLRSDYEKTYGITPYNIKEVIKY